MNENQTQPNVDVCPYWLAGFLDTSLRRLIHKPEKILAGMVQTGQTAVDVGCGPGFFTMGMASLVGEHGKVIALDMQEQMLERVKRNAQRAGWSSRVQIYQCTQEHLGLPPETAHFALTFWMVHEVPDQGAFMREVFALLKPGGHYLLVEPRIHVSEMDFQKTAEIANAAGFLPQAEPKINFSRSVLFKKLNILPQPCQRELVGTKEFFIIQASGNFSP